MEMNHFQVVKVAAIKEAVVEYPAKKIIWRAQDAVTIFQHYLCNVDREHFVVLCLSSKNEVICIHTAHIGSLNAAIVHPREVMKVAVLCNAASFMICHNHPSGDPTPSREDIDITSKLERAGALMGIPLIDHIIIGDDGRFTSLLEKGHITSREA